MSELNRSTGEPDVQSIPDNEDPVAEFRTTIRFGNKAQVSRALLHEFCLDSSVQGFKFFCERKRHWSERIFWIIAFVIATYFSGNMIANAWTKWNDTPVIVSFSEKTTPVWAIPFPAVTICPETKTCMTKLNFTDVYLKIVTGKQINLTEETMNKIEAMIQLCIPIVVSTIDFTSNYTDSHIYDILKDIAPTYSESFSFCSWNHYTDVCIDSFQPIITEEGICYTFNALNSREIYTEEIAPEMMTIKNNKDSNNWNLEDGYSKIDRNKRFSETYPRRVLDSGDGSGLHIFLTTNATQFEYICSGPAQGFKVVLHMPGEIPHVSRYFFRLPTDREAIVSIKPNIITTSNKLREYNANERQCFFSSERRLRFFKVYTQRNCELECISNFTKIECGCVKFSSPRDKYTPICGAAKVKCYNEARNNLIQKVFEESVYNDEAYHRSCNCLPACTSITYDAEISQSKFNLKKLFHSFGFERSMVHEFGDQMSSLSMSFKEQQFQTSRRTELTGLVDFLANCGGILGLFIGVTALSFVEIFYYCSLRLYWTLRLYRFNNSKNGRKLTSHPYIDKCDNSGIIELTSP